MAGGIIRDLLIGVPLPGFPDRRYIVAAAVAGLTCFVFFRLIDRIDRPIQVVDALGLALFGVTGTTGGAGGRGGSVPGGNSRRRHRSRRRRRARRAPRRDPVGLHRDLYAIPALLGGTVVAIADTEGSDHGIFAPIE